MATGFSRAGAFRRLDLDVGTNDSGMTLVEVMVVSAIMMILAYGFMTMMTNVGNQQRAVEVKASINQLSNGVRGLSSAPSSLQNSVGVSDE